ncbi:MAG: tetratricopeptide repeat protein [Candidatus Krumholzibacteriota bacterium]|nr:tetratricopeptide repeat protein [Candidatus Krumholzibacteriota bacterium]
MKKLNILFLVALSGFLFGCSTPYIKAQGKYFSGDPAAAEEILAPAAEKEVEKSGKNKNLYLWDLGVYRFFQGNYDGAIESFHAGVVDADMLHTAGETVGAAFTSASSQNYVGDPVEVSLAYFYLGLSYYMKGDYQNALVGFRRSLEEDISKDLARQGDIGITNYMMGEVFFRTGRYDDAAVAFKRAVDYKEGFLPGYAGMYQSNVNLNRVSDLGIIEEKIVSIGGQGYFDGVRENSGSGITLLMMSGRASKVKSDAFTGAFRNRAEFTQPDPYWKGRVDENSGEYRLYLADRMHDHFEDQGGAGDEVKKQATRALVSEGMKAIPVLSLFAPSTAADVRYWPTLPGGFYVGYFPLEPGSYSVEVTGVNRSGADPDTGNQWDGIEVKENRRTLVVMNSFGSVSRLRVRETVSEEEEGGGDEEEID